MSITMIPSSLIGSSVVRAIGLPFVLAVFCLLLMARANGPSIVQSSEARQSPRVELGVAFHRRSKATGVASELRGAMTGENLFFDELVEELRIHRLHHKLVAARIQCTRAMRFTLAGDRDDARALQLRR